MDFKTAKPREVEAYLREQVRKIFGDKIKNASSIYGGYGRYTIYLDTDPRGSQDVEFRNFRKTDVPKIVKAMRALKG